MDFDAAFLVAAIGSPVWGLAAAWVVQRLTRRGRLERQLLRDAEVLAAMPEGAAKRAVQSVHEKTALEYAATRVAPAHFYEPIHLFVGLQLGAVFALFGLLAMLPATAEWGRALFDGFPNVSGADATARQQDNLWATAFFGAGVTMALSCWFFMRVEVRASNQAALEAMDAEVAAAEVAEPEAEVAAPPLRWWKRAWRRG